MTGQEDVIERFVRCALDSDLVAEATVAPGRWREVYVGAPEPDEAVVDGYVDLLFGRGDGLVVVDHKTGRVERPEALAAKADRYRVHFDAYRRAVATATG